MKILVLNFIRERRRRKDEELKEVFQRYLENKYYESFVIEGIYRVNWGRGIRYTALFSPVANPKLKSELAATKDGEIVGDNYINDCMSEKFDPYLVKLAKRVLVDPFMIFSYFEPFDDVYYPPEEFTNKNMNLADYLARNSHNIQNNMWIFIKRDSDIALDDLQAEADIINKFVDDVMELGLIHLEIYVAYTKPDYFEKLKKVTKDTWGKSMENFYDKSKTWLVATIVIYGSEKIVDFMDEI